MLVCREPLTAIFCSPRHWMLFSKNCLLAQDIASIKNLCIGNETWSGTVYCLFMIVSSDPGYPLKLRRSRLRILFTRRSKCVTSCGAEWPRSLGRNPVRSWGELSSQTLCLNKVWTVWFELYSLPAGTTSTHIQSICDAMEIPHIETRWDFRVRRDDYSINLYPNPKVISKVRMSSFMTRYSNVDTERDQGILAP